MNENKKYISATLIFAKKLGNDYNAIQSSYIFEIKSLLGLVNSIKSLSNDLINSEFKGYTYIGVSDLYISEEEKEFNFLGRTSFFDAKLYKESKKFVIDRKELLISFEKITNLKKANIGLVFFHQDEESLDYNSTLIIYSQIIKNNNIENKLNKINTDYFKNKIITFSVEQLYLEGLNFVGVSELYEIRGTGLFQKQANFIDIQEINSLVYSNNEFNERYEEVLDDYKYVY